MRRLVVSIAILLLVACSAQAQQTISMTGTVVDAEGKGVAGASVRAILSNGYLNKAEVKATATSGGDGSFTLDSLPALGRSSFLVPASRWHYALVADTPDGGFGWTSYYGKPGEGTLPADFKYSIKLSKLTAGEGRVVDEDGKGVADVSVSAEEVSKKGTRALASIELQLALPSKPAVTDSDGRFRLEGVPEGARVSFRVEKEGFFQKTSVLDGTVIIMAPGGSISGRVVDSEGKPAAGVRVVAQASARQSNDSPAIAIQRVLPAGSRVAHTGTDGSYVMKGLNTLNFTLGIEDSELVAPLLREVIVLAGKTTTASDLIARRGTKITGRVLDFATRNPVTNAVVQVWDSSGTGSVMADDSGVYHISALPGKAILRYVGENPDYLPDYEKTEIDASASEIPSVDILVHRADVIKGKVTDEAGKVVQQATVRILSPDRQFMSDRTDAQGSFEMRIRPPKPMLHAPDADTWEPGMLVVKVETPDLTQGVFASVSRDSLLSGGESFTVHPAHTLTVTAKDEKGNPLQGVAVSVYSRHDFSGTGKPAVTDTKGQTQINGLYTGGRYALNLTLKGYSYSQNSLPVVGSAGWKDSIEVTMKPSRTSPISPAVRRMLETLPHSSM